MFEPLINASLQIQIHVIAAIVAIALGPVAIYRRRRDIWHKTVGYVWIVAMVATIASSFLIFEIRLIGPISPIHFLSVFAAYNLTLGLKAAIASDIIVHRAKMRGLYFWALGIAGFFTLMPGRIISKTLYGSHQIEGLAVTVVFLAFCYGVVKMRKQKHHH